MVKSLKVSQEGLTLLVSACPETMVFYGPIKGIILAFGHWINISGGQISQPVAFTDSPSNDKYFQCFFNCSDQYY
jgi:hypothetical protein